MVAEVGRKRILEVDPATGVRRVLKDQLPIGFPGLPQAPLVYIPTGVAASLTGDVYFTSDTNAAVYRLRRL